MGKEQSISINSDFFGDYTSTFIKLITIIISVYVIIIILNFLRDKFINKETNNRKDEITGLLALLNKLFVISGIGFIIANIIQWFLNTLTRNNPDHLAMNFKGVWDHLTFGVILIFIGIALKSGWKILNKNKKDEAAHNIMQNSK